MTISSEGIKTERSSIAALLSLDEEVFLETLTRSPYLFESKEVKERLKEISRDWKKRIELKKSRERSWEHILYLVHLFPRSLDLPEFAWLKEKYFNILMRRQWDSENDHRKKSRSLSNFTLSPTTLQNELLQRLAITIANRGRERYSRYSHIYLQQVWMVILFYHATTGEIGCTWNASSCDDPGHRDRSTRRDQFLNNST